MPSASATKASDKVTACKKLTTLLQKDYGKTIPKLKHPVLETILFAVCLEDSPWKDAEASYEKLLKSYFDLNEIRVSSVTELERTLNDLKDADWKGLRIRSILRFVFESTYGFEFEKLARLTLESAQKRLKKVEHLSPFVTAFTLQQVLGSHVVIIDNLGLKAAIHLGIVPPDSSITDAAEFLKAGVKKSECFTFSYLLHCLATDPKLLERIEDEPELEDEFNVLNVAERLTALKSPRKTPKKKVAKKKTATKKVAAKKTTAKKSPAKVAAKKVAQPKTAAKKKTATKKKTVKTSKTSTPAKKKAASKTTPAKSVTKKKKKK